MKRMRSWIERRIARGRWGIGGHHYLRKGHSVRSTLRLVRAFDVPICPPAVQRSRRTRTHQLQQIGGTRYAQTDWGLD